MKRQMAAIMTGAILAMSAITLPAFATGASTSTQPSMGAQQQKQAVRTTGVQKRLQKGSLQGKGGNRRLSPLGQAKLKTYQAAIAQGLSPQAAAKKAGITKVIQLKSTKGQYQSLSKKTSATPQVKGQTKAVKVVRAGRNVKPASKLSQNQPVRPR